jgi:DNA polymerase-3 subunit beta
MFTVNKSVLSSALADVMKGLAAISTLPVLECILFAVEGQRLRLTATNLELTIQKWVSLSSMAFTEEAIAIPGKLIKDLVSLAPEGDIQMEINSVVNEVIIVAGKTKNVIKCIDPREFPPIYPVPDHHSGELPGNTWKQIGERVAYASDKTNAARPVLQGVLLDFDRDALHAVATDGFRIAVQKFEFETPTELRQTVLIPAGSLEKTSLILDEQNIRLLVDERQMIVFNDDTLVAYQRIDGKFPDWKAIMPPSFNHTLNIAYEDLDRAIRQAMVVARERKEALTGAISLASEDKSVVIAGEDGMGSKSQSVIHSDLVSQSLFTANGVFLMQTLKAMHGVKTVQIRANARTHPLEITSAEMQDYTVIMMPMESTSERNDEMLALARQAAASMGLE